MNKKKDEWIDYDCLIKKWKAKNQCIISVQKIKNKLKGPNVTRSRQKPLRKIVNDLSNTVENLSQTVDNLSHTVEGIDKRVTNLEITVNKLGNIVINLAKEMRDGFKKVNERLDNLENEQYKANIRLDNLENRLDTIIRLNNLRTC